MTVEQQGMSLGRRKVIVGIRLDGHARELLDWALVKVADAGDIVVAIHVCRNSDWISKDKAVLESYLEDYQGLCNQKKVSVGAEVLKGNSIRKVLVREAKNLAASAVIVGLTKHGTLGGWTSVTKYCVKKLPLNTDVMAIHNGKVIFRRCSANQFEGHRKDPRPSYSLNENLLFKDTQSEFGESEVSEMSRFSFDARDNLICSKDEAVSPLRRLNRGSLSSISLPVEDFTQQRPGWPLLQTASSITQPALEARKMSVVQWVMNLPHRPLSEVPESYFTTIKTEHSIEKEEGKLASLQELPPDLESVLVKNSAECQVFSRAVLIRSTSGFSSNNLIGKGGCNSVYKGILPGGKPVAVKILQSSKEARKDFIQEVDIMTTVKHKRITSLVGICVEDDHLISVYDFLPKGNLEENLHGNKKENLVLSWEARFKIAVGIAEALNYLHNECQTPVIHRDVKSSNILLNDALEPQLSDFGLAIWGPKTAPFLTDSDVVGTFGYLAPEYFMYGKVSDKIDVYAFGVVLLELLSGKKPIGLETAKGQESLILWAKPKLENGDWKSILDSKLEDNIDETQLRRIALAATLCLTQAARLRPKMYQILSILRGQEYHDGVKLQTGNSDVSENQDDNNNDDEVYPDSSAESHLSLAFLDVNDDSTSFSSLDQSSPLSVEEYLKKRWSRTSSLE